MKYHRQIYPAFLICVLASGALFADGQSPALDGQNISASEKEAASTDQSKLKTPFWSPAHATVDDIQAELLLEAQRAPLPERPAVLPGTAVADGSEVALPADSKNVVKRAEQLRALGPAASLNDVRQVANFTAVSFDPAPAGRDEDSVKRAMEQRLAAREITSRFAAALITDSSQDHMRRKQDLLLLANLSFRLNRDEKAYFTLLSAAAEVDGDPHLMRALEIMGSARPEIYSDAELPNVLESLAQQPIQ